MTLRAVLLAGACAAGIGVCVEAEEQPRRDVAGTYVSSLLGGCSLQLEPRHSFILRCAGRAPESGKYRWLGDELWIPDPFARGAPAYMPPQIDPRSVPAWPPSLEDPTAPLLASKPTGTTTLVLKPVRWGQRTYLLEYGHLSFCRIIERGLEPRKVAMGPVFLRDGDHRKPADRRPPWFCRP
jgi:hypothetical protein